MKRILLVSGIIICLVIIAGFLGFRTAQANIYGNNYDSGCYVGNLYSVTTGMPCSGYPTNNYSNYPGMTTVFIPGCDGYNLYSIITGEPCNQTQPATSYLFVRELEVGVKGEEVTALQQLLRDQGYFFGRVDGAYGPITRNAVASYQRARGFVATGRADWQTLNSLTNAPITPPMPVPPYCYPYTYNCQPSSITASISYLAPNYGRVGSQVIVYGKNFSQSGNTVKFGSILISNIYSYNGTSLSFNVPAVPQIYCFQAPCVENFNISVSNTNTRYSNGVIYTVLQ
ncbi:MAG: peptidoglycan-binding protein [Candidatus Paceibacterota bacterium]